MLTYKELGYEPMDDNYTIEIRFGDDNLTPNKMRSHDIATMISAIERMVAVIVARDNPALNIDESKVTVGLSGIRDGSYVMQFQSQYQNEVQRAYEKITRSIAEQDYANIPSRSIEAIRKVISVSREYRTDTLFGYRNGKFVHLATISATTKIEVSIPEITGRTTLYGMLTGIIGEHPPAATLTLLNGVKLRCNVTEQDNLRVARQLGKRLYTEVGVKGEARWDLRDMSLTFFRIDELLDYQSIPVTEAIDNLYRIAGEHFEAIDDIDNFITDLRGEV